MFIYFYQTISFFCNTYKSFNEPFRKREKKWNELFLTTFGSTSFFPKRLWLYFRNKMYTHNRRCKYTTFFYYIAFFIYFCNSDMERIRHIKRAYTLLCATFLAMTAWGQDYITKSGTYIMPAEKPAIAPVQMPKHKTMPEYSTAGSYIIVTTTDLAATMQPFEQWKRQQGFRVRTLCTESPHRDSIRASLSKIYHSCTITPFYVLLVGDVDRIPAFQGKYRPSGLSNHNTDLYYGEYSGDYIPEALVGRLSVADSVELENVVRKIISYEQGYYANAYSQILLVAGEETRTPAPVTTNGQVNYLSQLTSLYRPETDTICFHNPASGSEINDIIIALNQGNTIVNYTSHCTAQGWTRPELSIAALDTIDIPVPSIFVNNCCRSNAFGGNCIGEELLRKPQGGAAAVIGATNETLWDEDYYWAVGAKHPVSLTPVYDSLLPGAFDPAITRSRHDIPNMEGLTSLGALLYSGCSAVTLSGSPFDAFYWEIYCLLGDPSMTPFWTHPDTLAIVAPDSLPAGATSVTLHCNPYSRVSVTIDTTLLATGITDADGMATLWFPHALDSDSLTLTATRAEAICHISNHAVFPPQSATLAAEDYHLDDSLLTIRIKNVGLQPAINHYLFLSPNASPHDAYSTVIPYLGILHDTVISFILSETTPYTWPCFTANLLMQDSNRDTYSTLHLSIPLPDIRPVLTQLQLLNMDNSVCLQLLPDSDYQLSFTFAHMADSVTIEVADYPAITLYPSANTIVSHIHTPDSFNHLHLAVTPQRKNWSSRYSYWLTAHKTTEGFETGNLSCPPWQQTNLYSWLIDSTHSHNGNFCLRSAPIDNSQKSVMALDLNVMNEDSVSFYYNVSSEVHDWLYFYVDGLRKNYWSGNNGWRRYSFLLSSGQHRLEWVYQKDISISEHDDCAYIDDITLPLALWTQPYGTPAADNNLAIPPSPSCEQQITLFPNPVQSVVTIQLPESTKNRTIMVYDNIGRLADKINIPSCTSSTQYFTSHLRLGIYTLVMYDKEDTFTKKMIVIR